MASVLKLRRGTTSTHSSFIGSEAEITYDTTTKGLVAHDGETPGGFPTVGSKELAGVDGASLIGVSYGKSQADKNSASAEWVSSIAELRALSSSEHKQVFVSGYYEAGDGGGGEYYFDATPTDGMGSTDDGGLVIVGNDGSRWKLLHTGTVNTRQFGVVSGADSTTSLQNALSSGLHLVHDVYCLASAKLTHSGSVMFHGVGKGQCGITWVGATGGFDITPESWFDRIEIRGLDLLTTTTIPTETAMRISWLHLGTLTTIPYFDRRAYVEKLRISGTNTLVNGWKKGIEFDYPFSVEVHDCEIFGKYLPSSLLSTDFVSGSVGIDIPDQTNRTLTGVGIANCVFLGWHTGVFIRNVEGVWIEGNDLQVGYDGIVINNTISKANQYRVRFNHIGVSGSQFKAKRCRHLVFIGNEVSYRYGRVDGGTVELIELDSVYGVQIVGNTVRGNVSTDTNVILDGIAFKCTVPDSVADRTRKITASGNLFANIRHAFRNDAGNDLRYFQQNTNLFDGIRGSIITGVISALAHEPVRVGVGNFEVGSVAATNTAVHIVNFEGSALTLDRQSQDGIVLGFRRDGTLVGNVATTATTTAYNTNSDQRLKVDAGILTRDAARVIISSIKVHMFNWLLDSKQDIGTFAQELHAVYPNAVTVGHGEPGDSDFIPWGVDNSKLVPLLIAAI